ncbi:hypothetical protein H4Q26_005794 [Puccinia striiformis f. sp. tritici PST-130]|nr:hypothetical protein H4Q26_005794 [Puccinia striiformis f. sp. tritici PST-130]
MLGFLKTLIFFAVCHRIGGAMLLVWIASHIWSRIHRVGTLSDLDHQVVPSNAVDKYEYGIALDGSFEKKGEIEVGNGSMAKNYQTDPLDPKTKAEFSQLANQVESLRGSLKKQHGRSSEESRVIWKSLQMKLTEFKVSQKEHPDPTKAEMVPSHDIEDSKIFQPNFILEMVEFHMDLLFLKRGPRFFDSPDSVIPQEEFMRNGLAFKHFHEFIRFLPEEDKKKLVYMALRSTLLHMPECFPQENQLGHVTPTIRQLFLPTGFLQQADRLTANVKLTGALDMDRRGDDFEAVHLISYLINYFRFPSSEGAQKRIELQTVFYMLEFFEDYYKPLMEGIFASREDRPLFEAQLQFMRGYLKYFRNRDQYPKNFYTQSSILFSYMAHSPALQYRALRPWVEEFILRTFEHDSWFKGGVIQSADKKRQTDKNSRALRNCVIDYVPHIFIGVKTMDMGTEFGCSSSPGG